MRILIADILQSKAQTLINTVNCVGVMGKGIALEFKERFPEMNGKSNLSGDPSTRLWQRTA